MPVNAKRFFDRASAFFFQLSEACAAVGQVFDRDDRSSALMQELAEEPDNGESDILPVAEMSDEARAMVAVPKPSEAPAEEAPLAGSIQDRMRRV